MALRGGPPIHRPAVSGTRALIAICLGATVPACCQDDALRRAERLDSEHKCEEAERYYQESLSKHSPSAALLNNLGNHYLICDHPDQAEQYFERLLKINPAHANANLQLARIAVERKQGTRALEYLSNVNDASPAVRLLRAEASKYAGKSADALRILQTLEQETGGDARVLVALGITCARIGFYDRAETAFNGALAAYPNDFDILFNLGRAAARAQHWDRAQRVLEVAVKLRPTDADALLELGLVYASRQDYSHAVYVLAQARQHAPQRPDILLALGRAAEDAGYYGDSALAYDEYLRLRPGDDTSRRDRGRVCGYTGTRLAEGIKELTWYVHKHPEDPIGYFDLAQFTWRTDPQTALRQLTAALRLDPELAPAHYARAWLLHRLGRTADSLADLQAACRLQPKNVRALDQLGLTYLSLEQALEAEKVLRKALAIAPQDPQVLLHLGRALISLDRQQEAQVYLDQFQKFRTNRVRDPRREPGMIELATMSQEDRARTEIERLRRDAGTHPGDPELQLHLAGLLLAEGRIDEATAAYGELLSRNADANICRQAGRELARAGQYKLAKNFLERAAAVLPASRLDLAIVSFFADGPQRALEVIDTVPKGEQDADYFLMKARILDAAGRSAEAEKILVEGLRPTASRPDVAQQAALLFFRFDRPGDALTVLAQASQSDPDNPDVLLQQAVILALTDRPADAGQILQQIEIRWPEWGRAYLVHGLLFESIKRSSEARQKLQTAVALDSTSPAARCALARLEGRPDLGAQCNCTSSLRELLFAGCENVRSNPPGIPGNTKE
jgi:tetratricopeptide (TPR) repeat protein